MKKLFFFSFFFLLSTVYYLLSSAKPAYAAAILISPANGATNVGTCSADGTKAMFNFTWTPQDYNGYFHFYPADGQYLDISTDGGSTWLGTNVSIFEAPTVYIGTWPASNAPPNTTITWRINTHNSIDTNWYPSPNATFTTAACTPGGGGGGSADIGTIQPGTLPAIPSGGNASDFVANIIKAAISLLLIVAFIIDLLWTIIAGLRFITAGGDPKTVGSAWSQIYWGLIGMLVVLGSFAIIKLVETFFGVNIISGGFQLPTI